MGSPHGPLLADVFMAKLENNVLKSTINRCKLYRRYVDDILCFIDENVNLSILNRIFNSAHPNIKFTFEEETDNQIPFLDVLLSRRSDGSIQRSVYRKPTWTSQYIHFRSFVPLKRKRNLILCLVNRANRICTDDKTCEELNFIRGVFLQNGYPERFIDSTLKHHSPKEKTDNVEKKAVYISLPFKGDTMAEIVTRKLTTAVEKTFHAAQLRIMFKSRPLIRFQLKDKVPASAVSYCVYSFTCSCGTKYIGRTSRHLATRVREHHPVWLNTGVTKTITSAILSHLVDSGHSINVTQAFRPIYRVPVCRSKPIKNRILATAEAVGIRLFNPPLCAQKQFVKTLILPWPTPHPNTQLLVPPNDYPTDNQTL